MKCYWPTRQETCCNEQHVSRNPWNSVHPGTLDSGVHAAKWQLSTKCNLYNHFPPEFAVSPLGFVVDLACKMLAEQAEGCVSVNTSKYTVGCGVQNETIVTMRVLYSNICLLLMIQVLPFSHLCLLHVSSLRTQMLGVIWATVWHRNLAGNNFIPNQECGELEWSMVLRSS